VTWDFLHPASHLVLTCAALLFGATLAFVIPVIVALRRRSATDAIAWADRVRRDDATPWAVDRVLRSVEASCRAAGVVFPGFVRASVGSTVRLDLTSPTVAPPEPWTATPDGRSWSAPMHALQAVGLTEAASVGFATVVGLGTDQDGSVLVDLAAVGGVVALGGDRAARLAVARRVVDQVRTDPWSRTTPVVTVGVRDEEFGPAASVSVVEAIATVAADATPGLLVVQSIPGGPDGRELARLLERPSGRWAVLALQPSPLARWTLECRRDGTSTSAELGTVRWMDLGLSDPVVDHGPEAPIAAAATTPAGTTPAGTTPAGTTPAGTTPAGTTRAHAETAGA
jgi:hypothetical protein